MLIWIDSIVARVSSLEFSSRPLPSVFRFASFEVRVSRASVGLKATARMERAEKIEAGNIPVSAAAG